MSKTKVLRLYTFISSLIGIGLLAVLFTYISKFTTIDVLELGTLGSYYGEVSKGILNITFSNLDVYSMTIIEYSIFNLFGIFALLVLVGNIVFAVIIGNTDEVEDKTLKEGYQYNILMSLTVLLGHVLFLVLVPSMINGQIVNKFFYLEIPKMANDIVFAVNINFVMLIVYILFNLIIFFKTAPERVREEDEFDEELYEQDFYTSLSQTEQEVENTESK